MTPFPFIRFAPLSLDGPIHCPGLVQYLGNGLDNGLIFFFFCVQYLLQPLHDACHRQTLEEHLREQGELGADAEELPAGGRPQHVHRVTVREQVAELGEIGQLAARIRRVGQVVHILAGHLQLLRLSVAEDGDGGGHVQVHQTRHDVVDDVGAVAHDVAVVRHERRHLGAFGTPAPSHAVVAVPLLDLVLLFHVTVLSQLENGLLLGTNRVVKVGTEVHVAVAGELDAGELIHHAGAALHEPAVVFQVPVGQGQPGKGVGLLELLRVRQEAGVVLRRVHGEQVEGRLGRAERPFQFCDATFALRVRDLPNLLGRVVGQVVHTEVVVHHPQQVAADGVVAELRRLIRLVGGVCHRGHPRLVKGQRRPAICAMGGVPVDGGVDAGQFVDGFVHSFVQFLRQHLYVLHVAIQHHAGIDAGAALHEAFGEGYVAQRRGAEQAAPGQVCRIGDGSVDGQLQLPLFGGGHQLPPDGVRLRQQGAVQGDRCQLARLEQPFQLCRLFGQVPIRLQRDVPSHGVQVVGAGVQDAAADGAVVAQGRFVLGKAR